MKNYILTDQPDDIDAVDFAVCPALSEEGSSALKAWRRRPDNPFAFSGKRNQKLHTYVDGIGLTENSVELRETSALKNLCFLVTGCALLYSFIENVLIVPLMLFFNALGIEISYSFHESIAYGNQYAVLTVQVIIDTLKLLLPLIVLHKKLKMPKLAAVPTKITSVRAVVEAMCLACVGFCAIGLLRCFIPMEIFSVENIGMTFRVIDYMGTFCTVGVLVMEFLIVPVLMELIFHGALFRAMTQFGPGFAIIFIAILNTLIMHNPSAFHMIFITSFAAGYGVWKSGSVLTGILIQAKLRFLNFVVIRCEDMPDFHGVPVAILCIALIFVEAMLGMLLLKVSRMNHEPFRDYRSFIHIKEKAKISIWGSSMLAVWVLCAILLIIEIVM